MEADWNDIFKVALGSAITALIAWAGTAGRNAIRNYGRTDFEIKAERARRASEDLLAAKMTPDENDDKAAAAVLRAAEEQLASARKLKAITDSLGSDPKASSRDSE